MKNLRRQIANANALVVFESAARLLSFTRAADELGISQPAVSRHIRTVEATVGRPLFQRNHNRLVLTDEGLRLWSSVSSGFGDIATTLSAIRGEGRRRLLLATHAGFAQQWLMERFSGFCELVADFDVRLLIADTDAEIDRGDFDFAVRIGTGHWPDHLSHLLVPETIYPVAAPAFLERHPDLVDVPAARLIEAPLLHMDEGDKPWMTWHAWFRAQGVGRAPSHPDVIYNNYPLVLQEALAGKGVALAWRPLVESHLRQGTLVRIGATLTSDRTGYFLTWPSRSPSRELAASVCAWFDRQISPPATAQP